MVQQRGDVLFERAIDFGIGEEVFMSVLTASLEVLADAPPLLQYGAVADQGDESGAGRGRGQP